MTYVSPTVADVLLIHAEFTPVSEALIQHYLDEAIAEVGDTWFEGDRAKAQRLLTCHRLSAMGEPEKSLAIASGSSYANGARSDVVREKVGDVEAQYAAPDYAARNAVYGDYTTTIYGRLFIEIRRNNFPSVRVV